MVEDVLQHRVTIRALLDNDDAVVLHPGAIIGRLATSTVRIRDPRISEAHALVSLRGHDIKLLALRGRFAVDGEVSSSVVLEEGLSIQLARGVTLRIVDITRPAKTLGLQLGQGPVEVLSGVTSIYGGSLPRIEPGWHRGANDVVWDSGEGWERASDQQQLSEGMDWVIDGCPITVRSVDVAGAAETLVETAFAAPLTVETTYDTVHIYRSTHLLTSLAGVLAQLVSELASIGQPVDWQAVAAEIWGDLPKPVLRKRWDASLYRIRKKFRDAGVRMDLVACGGTGLAELRLRPEDQLIDRS